MAAIDEASLGARPTAAAWLASQESRSVNGTACGPDEEESPEETRRREEWIKYYIRQGDPHKAFELGWDGKPFEMAVAGEESPQASTPGCVSANLSTKRMHRL